MLESRRRFVPGLLLILGAGALIGWIYDRPLPGLLIAALLALLWQVRYLLAFDRALRNGNFDAFRTGDGIWQQIFSRFHYEQDRGDRYKDQNRQLLEEIRKSTNAMPDGAVILDAENEIVTCNRAAKHLAGLKRKKDRGQRVDNILRDRQLTELLQSDDQTRTIDIASPVTDGVWISCRVVPYGADQKLLLLRDETDRIALNRMRRDFVANASHELRSPLTVIAGYLDAIDADKDFPSEWAKPVSQMQSQSRRMTRIISELLELSRLEGAGRASTEVIIDVEELLVAGRHELAEQSDAPTIDIECESTAKLRGDRSEIESVISNLLSNAIRHTPPDGTVTLAWRANSKGADLIVSDSGEGISAEHIPRLTERFFRVDRGRSREDGGIGLGLAIVKHVLSRHETELNISSEPNSGSTFCCHFPPDRVIWESLS